MTITNYLDDPFVALADFKSFSRRPENRLKLLTASTASRGNRNRHFGTLMRCFEAWDPVGKCFDPISFECIDFHGLGQIIASLIREGLAEREAEIREPSLATNGRARCLGEVLDFALGGPSKPMLRFHAVTDEDDHPLENEDESGKRLCEYWVTVFRHAMKAKGTTNMKISCDTFRKFLTTTAG